MMSAARLTVLLTIAGAGIPILFAAVFGVEEIDVLACELVLLPVAAWAAAGLLFLAHRRQPSARNLGERSLVAVRDAIVATLGAVLGLSRLLSLRLEGDTAIGIIGVSLLLVTAYPIAWIVQFYRGRWD
jgi:hypothetical protein